MATSAGIRIANAYVEIGGDDSKLQGDLDKTMKRLKSTSFTSGLFEKESMAEARGMFGAKSAMGIGLKTLAGGGAIGALSFASKAFAEETGKFSNAMRDADSTASSLTADFVHWIPILGNVEKGFENISASIAYALVGGVHKFNSELADSIEKLGQIRDQASRGVEEARNPPINELDRARRKAQDEWEKGLSEANAAEAKRREAEKDISLSPSVEYTKTILELRNRYYAELEAAEKAAAEKRGKEENDRRNEERNYLQQEADKKADAAKRSADKAAAAEQQVWDRYWAWRLEQTERRERELSEARKGDNERRVRISELEAKTGLTGIDKELALLEIEHREARKIAKDHGEKLSLVEKEFALRKKMIEQEYERGRGGWETGLLNIGVGATYAGRVFGGSGSADNSALILDELRQIRRLLPMRYN